MSAKPDVRGGTQGVRVLVPVGAEWPYVVDLEVVWPHVEGRTSRYPPPGQDLRIVVHEDGLLEVTTGGSGRPVADPLSPERQAWRAEKLRQLLGEEP